MMTTTNGKIAAIKAENAMLRQRISELEAQLTSHNDHAHPSNQHQIKEFRGFRTLVDTAPQAIGMITLDGIITYANTAFMQLTGYDSLIGLNMTVLHFEEDLPILRAHIQSLIASHVWRSVARLRRRDGRAIPVRVNAFVIRDDDGQPMAMTGMFEDLTEELQREEQLRLFEALVENAPDGIGVADINGNIIYANAAYQALTGYGADLIGMNGFDYILKEEHHSAQIALARLTEGKAAFLETRIQRKDGRIVPVAATMYAQPTPGGETRIIGFLRDISDQKRAEEE
ncbi:MAG: PAS domain-containing protein, partial [Roseiflexus sp.]